MISDAAFAELLQTRGEDPGVAAILDVGRLAGGRPLLDPPDGDGPAALDSKGER